MSKKKNRLGFIPQLEDIHTYLTYQQGWSADVAYTDACGEVSPPQVYVTTEVIGKMQFLLEKYPTDEWAADLIGNKESNKYIITDIYIFEQEVDSVTVVRKEPPPEGAIGTTHSHHSMGAFFSGTDDEYPNANHDLSGVVASQPDGALPFTMKFTARVKTPCGKYVRFNDVPVRILVEKKEVETDKIKKKEYQFNRRWTRTDIDYYDSLWKAGLF